jgi:hypothetical protein
LFLAEKTPEDRLFEIVRMLYSLMEVENRGARVAVMAALRLEENGHSREEIARLLGIIIDEVLPSGGADPESHANS